MWKTWIEVESSQSSDDRRGIFRVLSILGPTRTICIQQGLKKGIENRPSDNLFAISADGYRSSALVVCIALPLHIACHSVLSGLVLGQLDGHF